MSQRPTFGRRAAPPQPGAKRPAPKAAANQTAQLDLTGHAWGDDSDLRAWKGQRNRAMARAMGWRRWAFVGAMVLGAIIRWQAHSLAFQVLGMGLGLIGFLCLWAGRKRYAESL